MTHDLFFKINKLSSFWRLDFDCHGGQNSPLTVAKNIELRNKHSLARFHRCPKVWKTCILYFVDIAITLDDNRLADILSAAYDKK